MFLKLLKLHGGGNMVAENSCRRLMMSQLKHLIALLSRSHAVINNFNRNRRWRLASPCRGQKKNQLSSFINDDISGCCLLVIDTLGAFWGQIHALSSLPTMFLVLHLKTKIFLFHHIPKDILFCVKQRGFWLVLCPNLSAGLLRSRGLGTSSTWRRRSRSSLWSETNLLAP